MKTKKHVLIVTDSSKETAKMAADIVTALEGNMVAVKTASEFKGNDLLPADVFFLGCEQPSPDSFEYLTDLFKHINLAGRPCGVFSPGSDKAAEYLAALVHDSEAALNPKPLFAAPEPVLKRWVQNIVSGSF